MPANCQERDLCRDDYQKAAFELAQTAAYLANTFISHDLAMSEIAYAGLRAAQIKCAVARGIYVEHISEHGCDVTAIGISPKPSSYEIDPEDLLARAS